MEKEKILKALETIKEVCREERTCSTCPLRDSDNDCICSNALAPCHWEINNDNKPWRAICN